jgi:hypothetical protein
MAHTVIVRSPSPLRETGLVVRIGFHVLLWTAIVMGATHHASLTGEAATAIGDVAFRSLPGDVQRMYRRCLDGLAEAEAIRAQRGTWPEVGELEVPPFTPDPIDRAGYRWTLLRDRTAINYVGVPQSGPTLVIAILEPEPGAVPDPTAYTDEQHHRLADGTMLHVAIWEGTKPVTTAMIAPAIEDGWRRITRGAP